MDNLCHSLVGAALAESGLRRRTRYATAALVLGANFPDLDVIAVFTEHGLGFRRGITHGLPALVVLPVLLTLLLLLWHRAVGAERRRGGEAEVVPRELLRLSALAVLTHPVLDWMNVYGMRWLMPLDGTWFYGDSLFIVDPWLLLMLGAAWIVGRGFRRRQDDASIRSGQVLARAMVTLAAVYIAGMMTLTALGRRIAARDLGLERPGRRELMVAPPFLDSWRRRVTVDAGDHYRFGHIDWWPAPHLVISGPTVPKNPGLIEGLPMTSQLEDLLDWGRFVYAAESDAGVQVDDARYSRPGGRSFAGVVYRR